MICGLVFCGLLPFSISVFCLPGLSFCLRINLLSGAVKNYISKPTMKLTPKWKKPKTLYHKHFCKKKKVDSFRYSRIKTINLIWSEWRDSNSRHPGLKDERKLFSNHFRPIWRCLFRNLVLSGTVFSVVSGCSNPVYGQKCGQRPGLSKSQGVLGSRSKIPKSEY